MPSRVSSIVGLPASLMYSGNDYLVAYASDSWTNSGFETPNWCAIDRFVQRSQNLSPGVDGKYIAPLQPTIGNYYAWFGVHLPRNEAAAYNQAYSRYRKALLGGGGAELGVTIAQWRQALEMLNLRTRALRALSERQVGRMRSIQREMYRIKRKRRPTRSDHKKLRSYRKLSSYYLEGVFGWMPLFGDIHSALETLTNLQGLALATGRGRSRDQGRYTASWPGVERVSATLDYEAKCCVQAWYKVTNPNLYLASAVGLTNPLAIAWDIIPWSFMLSYISNVGTVVRAIAPTLGIAISRGSITHTQKGTTNTIYRVRLGNPGRDALASGEFYRYYKGRSVTTSFAIPSLSLRPPSGWRAVADNFALYLQNVEKIRSITSTFK